MSWCDNSYVDENNLLIVEDVHPARDYVVTEDGELDQNGERTYTVNTSLVQRCPVKQNAQNHHRQGSHQLPKHVDSSSDLLDLKKDDLDTEDNVVYEPQAEFQLESDQDGVTDDSISALEEPFMIYDKAIGNKEEKDIHPRIEGVQNQRKSSTQINSNCETLTVAAAGNPAVNGVYRWFAAHARFVMFTDQGQYQIMRGVDLPEYGDSYNGCWVIEEIKEKMVRLYAVASGETNSISSDGWICINGALPAPIIKKGTEWALHDEACIESDASISSMQATYF